MRMSRKPCGFHHHIMEVRGDITDEKVLQFKDDVTPGVGGRKWRVRSRDKGRKCKDRSKGVRNHEK